MNIVSRLDLPALGAPRRACNLLVAALLAPTIAHASYGVVDTDVLGKRDVYWIGNHCVLFSRIAKILDLYEAHTRLECVVYVFDVVSRPRD